MEGADERFMSNSFDCHYGETEIKTVESGMDAVKKVLEGEDIAAKQRLLFYLDWFMDPYYKQDTSKIAEPLTELLQTIIITPNDEDVIGEAVHLLSAYTSGPYEILKAEYKKVPEIFKPDVLYLFSEEHRIFVEGN